MFCLNIDIALRMKALRTALWSKREKRVQLWSSFFYHSARFVTIIVCAASMLPLLYLVVRATNADHTLFTYVFSASTLTVIGKSLSLSATVMFGAAVLGIPFAWLTSRTDLPLARLWLILGVLPMVIPTYLIAVTFAFAFGPRGLVQGVLEEGFGVQRLPSIYGFFGTWLVLTLVTLPYVVLPLRAALRGTTIQLEEVALDLGANRWQMFRHILLPHGLPALFTGMTLAGLYSLYDFGAAAIMRYENFTHVIYLQYTGTFNRERAASLALCMIAISLILLFIERRISTRNSLTTTGTPHPPRLIRLGKWRYPATVYCIGIVLIGVGTPMTVLLHWLLTRTMARHVEYSLWTLTLNTFGLSAVAAFLTVLVALPIAGLVHASPSSVNRILTRLPYLTYALPGIVIGLASVFFTTQYLTVLYQTLPLLLAAYTLRFLPICIGTTQAAFSQINLRLIESAQALGAGHGQVFVRVLLPLSRSGILSGGALVFLAAMKELPIGLMLAPTGFHTLSYRIWSAYQEAIFSQIGLPGCVLMIVSLISIHFILRGEHHRESNF